MQTISIINNLNFFKNGLHYVVELILAFVVKGSPMIFYLNTQLQSPTLQSLKFYFNIQIVVT